MFGYVTFNEKYYILNQIFYKKKWVIVAQTDLCQQVSKTTYLVPNHF